MPTPNLQAEVQRAVNELMRLKDRVLPVKVGRAVRDSIRENFRQGGFYGQPWSPPLRIQNGFAGPAYGPLLSGTNHLMMTTDYIPGNGRVIIQNTLTYAAIHNEGGEITVTPRMRNFFWSQYYKRGLVDKSQTTPVNKEADFWKAMALKKVGSKIKIPQRQFMGEHPQVDKLVNDVINKELTNFIQNGISTRRSH